MNELIFCIVIAYLIILPAVGRPIGCIALSDEVLHEEPEGSWKVLKSRNPVKQIVNDLIDDWESPIAYLKSRGYLPKELVVGGEIPRLNIESLQKDGLNALEQDISKQKSKRSNTDSLITKEKTVEKLIESRPGRSASEENIDNVKNDDLKSMFHSLFSSKEDSVSKDIKEKLGVQWNLKSLKSSPHEEAEKYFNKYYNLNTANFENKNEINREKERTKDNERDLKALQKDILGDREYNAQLVSSVYSKPNFVKGIAKILGNRELMKKSTT